MLKDTTHENATISMVNVPFLADHFQTDSYEPILGTFLGFILMLVYILPIYSTVYNIVRERETRTKESMKIMGMKDSAYWLSWYVYYTFCNFLIAFICTTVLLFNIIKLGDFLFTFLFFFVFGNSVFGFTIFISAIIQKS